MPLLCLAATLAMTAWARGLSDLNRARSLLVSGHPEDAATLLEDLADSPVHGAAARAGLRIAAALAAEPAAAEPPGEGVDASPFPLAVLTRGAFERGEFAAALELIELADRLGQPTVPLVRTAALIEQNRRREVPAIAADARSTTLARRIGHYLQTAAAGAGVILRDRTGRELGYLDSHGEPVLLDGVRPELIPRAVSELDAARGDAASLRLSLDLELSTLAFDALGRYRGSIVLVDPANGDILAAVSDERSFREGGTPAFEERREPASIAKLITTTAALRAGLDPDDEISRMTCNGHRSYSGERLYCPYIAGPLEGLDRALAVSCNVAFADLGVRVGRRRMLGELVRYGFDSPLGPFPGGRILEPRGDERQLADLAIGLEATDLTPLHAALLAAVMANDGVMPVPRLLHAEDGRLGLHPRTLPVPPGKRVIEPRWLPQILSAMNAVSRRGTASRAVPHGFPAAMKTGTASDPRWGFHVNYIGIGPMPGPRLAFCVRITHQRTSSRVRDAAKSVTRRLLRGLGRVAGERGWNDASPPTPSRQDHALAHHTAETPDALRAAR